MKDLFNYLKSYKESMELRNMAAITITARLRSLRQFFTFIEEYHLTTLTDITRDHINDYQKYRYHYTNQYGRTDSPQVQNGHMYSIKTFFDYLKKEGYLIRNPAEDITYARRPKRLPQSALTNTEMKKLLNIPNTKTLAGYRDRTMMELLYSTGVRQAELLNLNLADVNYEEGYVRINQGKGNKDRITPLGKIACHYLETYIKGIRPFFKGAHDLQALFLSVTRTRRLGTRALHDIITKYAKISGIDKHITSHTFRRSCATEMIKNNASIMHVKDLLGHRSMDTIQTYCNLTITDLKKAHTKHHPRERDVQ